MANVEIKVISYEEARLSYFKELQERQKKRFEQFEKSSAIKELPPQERYYQLSKMGETLQYYDDVVKMLEADVVPKSEVEQLITLNSQLEAKVFDTRKEANILKSTITHKEEDAYNKGYADAKADILEKLQADIERDETLAEYGDELFEGRIAGFKAVINYLNAEGEE